MTRQEIAKYIDHTILKPDATPDMVKAVCAEAVQYGFASVCVNTCNVALAAAELRDSGVKTGATVGFPLGASTSAIKAFETQDAIANGAQEVDMVMNIGAAKAGDWALVEADIRSVVNAAKGRALVKVILETCLLTDDEKKRACTVCKTAGADYVKTSTGLQASGATVEDVKLMRKAVGADMGVKAAGGIRDFDTAAAMIAAGASRIGCSASVDIVTGRK